jgi:hypothetical protein
VHGLRDDPDSLRSAADSVSHWCDTVRLLFGDGQEALAWASIARILQRYPTWDAMLDTVRRVRNMSRQTDEIPESSETGSEVEEDELQSARVERARILADLDQLLRMLVAWHEPFRLGTWIASVAALGASHEDSAQRRLTGLQAMATVFSADPTLGPAAVVGELSRLTEIDAWIERLPDDAVKATREVLKRGTEMIDLRSRATVEVTPEQIKRASDTLREDAKGWPDVATLVQNAGWPLLEQQFWLQWRWPSLEPPQRQPTELAKGQEGTPALRATLLDLLHATHHGGNPAVPWAGGNLSIAQWCRVIGMADARDAGVPRVVLDSAFGNLGLAWLAYQIPQLFPLSGDEARSSNARQPAAPRLNGPVMLIYPLSVSSPASEWRPEPGLMALACPPTSIVSMGSSRPAETEAEGEVLNRSIPTVIATIVRLLARQMRGSIRLLHCVEVDPGVPASVARVPEALRNIPLSDVVFFGFSGSVAGIEPYVPAPLSAGNLLQRAMSIARERDRVPTWILRPYDAIVRWVRRYVATVNLVGRLLRRAFTPTR